MFNTMEKVSFKKYRRQSMNIAKQLGFPTEIRERIADARENREIYHLMIEGRLAMED